MTMKNRKREKRRMYIKGRSELKKEILVEEEKGRSRNGASTN